MFAILVVVEDEMDRFIEGPSDLDLCNWQEEGNSS